MKSYLVSIGEENIGLVAKGVDGLVIFLVYGPKVPQINKFGIFPSPIFDSWGLIVNLTMAQLNLV
jgi:hypothetical protein